MRTLIAITAVLLVALPLTACDSPDDADPDEPAAQQPDEQTDEQPDEQAADDDIADGEEGSDGEQPELADDLDPGETAHFGDEFTIDDDPIALTDALAQLDDADIDEPTSTLKVEARVEQVCEKKGCWFTLDDDDVETTVRIRMKDYGFFVPRNTADATSVVEGTVRRTMVEEEMARHYAEDAGEDPDQIDGPQEAYEFTATAVSLTAPDA